jgi:hypothetical protein
LYLVHRYYDPTTGQFLTVDPAVDDTDAPYAYVAGDPVNGTDLLGLCFLDVACGAQHAVDNAWRKVDPLSNSNYFRQQAEQNTLVAKIVKYGDPAFAAVDIGASAHGAIGFVRRHRVAVGIALATTAVLTGGTSLLVAGAFDAPALAAGLGVTSLATGGAATALDTGACIRHPGLNGSCVAAGLGGAAVVASAPELAVSLGIITEPAYQQFLALGVGSMFLGGSAALLDDLSELYDEVFGKYGDQKLCPEAPRASTHL